VLIMQFSELLLSLLLVLFRRTSSTRVLAASMLKFLDLTHTHTHTPQQVGLLLTSDQPVAAASTYKTNKSRTLPHQDSNPQSQQITAADLHLIPLGHRIVDILLKKQA
jgi:hypothetical protein